MSMLLMSDRFNQRQASPNKLLLLLKRLEMKTKKRKTKQPSRLKLQLNKLNQELLRLLLLPLLRLLRPESKLNLKSRLIQKRENQPQKKEKKLYIKKSLRKLRPEKLLTMIFSKNLSKLQLKQQPRMKQDIESFMRREKLLSQVSRLTPLKLTKLRDKEEELPPNNEEV